MPSTRLVRSISYIRILLILLMLCSKYGSYFVYLILNSADLYITTYVVQGMQGPVCARLTSYQLSYIPLPPLVCSLGWPGTLTLQPPSRKSPRPLHVLYPSILVVEKLLLRDVPQTTQ